MLTEFSKNYYLKGTDFDRNGKIFPRAVLEIFQDAATLHAEKLGCGMHDLLERKLFWVVVRNKFIIKNQPLKHSEVTVKTWPIKPRGYFLRREYEMRGENGELLIAGSSDWMVLSSETRAVAQPENVYPIKFQFKEELAISEPIKRIRGFSGECKKLAISPLFCDIDINGHVNNTRYADFALNASENQATNISSFQIDYLKEVLIGEELLLESYNSCGTTRVLAANRDGENKFACEIITE